MLPTLALPHGPSGNFNHGITILITSLIDSDRDFHEGADMIEAAEVAENVGVSVSL